MAQSITAQGAIGNSKELTVVKCTPMHKDSNKQLEVVGYKLKLQHKGVISVVSEFGETERSYQETYYLDVKQPCEVGLTRNLNMDNYTVVEKPYTIKEGEHAGEIANLKHLQVRK